MKKTFLIFLILAIVLVTINLIPGLNKGLGNFVYKIFSPIQKLFSNIGKGFANFFQVLASISDLNKENIEFKQKNLTLESEIVQFKEIKKENDFLREALKIDKKEYSIEEVASIVSKDIQGIQDWILINRGSNNGIKEGMMAISPEKALVGRITEVLEGFSKIMLISHKDSTVSAMLESSRIEGLVKRSDKGGLFMDFIPNTEKIEINEKIITSGMDNLYPRGIIVGTIESIDPSDNQIFQKIIISPAINFSKLENVIIIK
ncbi:MAG: rod shape-determining protein MreC [Patescibacteria group bacterium]